MSDMVTKYEDWLRRCVHRDGRKGNVYLPCDIVLGIADWIEAHRNIASVGHGNWIKDDVFGIPVYRCSKCDKEFWLSADDTPQGSSYRYCPNCGARMDGEDDDD